MKWLVKTTGDFSLQEPDTWIDIQRGRPTVIAQSNWVQMAVLIHKRLEKLAELPEEATQEGFDATLKACDGDLEMAIEVYLTELAPPAPPAQEETPPPPEKGKGKK